MSFHRYQVTFDTDGEVEKVVQLPDEPARKRTIIVREETEHKARRKAEDLYSNAT
jgi:hypothetical protein